MSIAEVRIRGYQKVGSRQRAESRFRLMERRCYGEEDRPAYEHVEVRFCLEEFVPWFMERDFPEATVDRIDPNGHYEFSNMRVISDSLNKSQPKRKTFANGEYRCYKCRVFKSPSLMIPSKRVTSGVSTLCKECKRLLNIEDWKRKKNDRY